MKNSLRLGLRVSPEQAARLAQLQKAFAQVCNALAPRVREASRKIYAKRFPHLDGARVAEAVK